MVEAEGNADQPRATNQANRTDADRDAPATTATKVDHGDDAAKVQECCKYTQDQSDESPWTRRRVVIEILLTAALVIATGLNAYFVWGQWDAMNNTLAATNDMIETTQAQVDATRDATTQDRLNFASQQRAWIAFDPIQPWPKMADDERYAVALTFRNVGHTIARNIRTYGIGIECDRGSGEYTIDFDAKGIPGAKMGVMAPGINYPMMITSIDPIERDSVAALSESTRDPLHPPRALRFFVLSLYEDEFGTERGTRVCLEYAPDIPRGFSFCPLGNEAW